jgi:hypothetical protein
MRPAKDPSLSRRGNMGLPAFTPSREKRATEAPPVSVLVRNLVGLWHFRERSWETTDYRPFPRFLNFLLFFVCSVRARGSAPARARDPRTGIRAKKSRKCRNGRNENRERSTAFTSRGQGGFSCLHAFPRIKSYRGAAGERSRSTPRWPLALSGSFMGNGRLQTIPAIPEFPAFLLVAIAVGETCRDS